MFIDKPTVLLTGESNVKHGKIMFTIAGLFHLSL